MNASLFNMLHDSTDEYFASVITNRVHIHLGGIFEKTINKYWTFCR